MDSIHLLVSTSNCRYKTVRHVLFLLRICFQNNEPATIEIASQRRKIALAVGN